MDLSWMMVTDYRCLEIHSCFLKFYAWSLTFKWGKGEVQLNKKAESTEIQLHTSFAENPYHLHHWQPAIPLKWLQNKLKKLVKRCILYCIVLYYYRLILYIILCISNSNLIIIISYNLHYGECFIQDYSLFALQFLTWNFNFACFLGCSGWLLAVLLLNKTTTIKIKYKY